RLLLRCAIFALPLLQSSFLEFHCDLLFPHRFSPLSTPIFEVSSCCFKRLHDQFALLFQGKNERPLCLAVVCLPSFQVGNSCLVVLNVSGDFTLCCLQAEYFTFGLLHSSFSRRDVRLANLDETLQAFETLLQCVFHFMFASCRRC